MKINWGFGVVLAFGLFIAFIFYFVYKVNFDKRYDYHMVESNYYKRELEFQNKIDREAETRAEGMKVEVRSSDSGLTLIFPQRLASEKAIAGVVRLYRPSDATQDFELPLHIVEGKMLIPNSVLTSGRWNVEVVYQYDGKEYRTQEKIIR